MEDAFAQELLKHKEKLQQKAPGVGHPHHNRNNGIHDQLDKTLNRTITPIIPPLKSLAALTSASKATTTQITILMRFIPAPGSPTLPSLELTLLMDPDTDKITPHSLRAVSRVTTHDILLPSHPVDIRLSETTSHILPGSAIADACPEMMDFLSSSDLRPSEGVLSTPARPPPLRLPSRILSSTHSSSSPVSYIFSGLELHRKVSTSVDGWKLSYTSIEAGQGGGRRAELALEGLRTDNDEVDENGLPLSEFEKFERGISKPSSAARSEPSEQKKGEETSSDEQKSGEEEKPAIETPKEEKPDQLKLADEKLSEDVQVEQKKTNAQQYVETLSRLALGVAFPWYGEMPERVSKDGEGLDSTGEGRTGGEEA